MRETVIQSIVKEKLIAIVRNVEEQSILPLAKALRAGGIRMIEVTFDQKRPESFAKTARMIETLRSEMEDILPGAGTVMSEAQLELAQRAGALYCISPHTDAGLIAQTRERGLVSLPGALTPSECAAAHAAGADFIKIFPAGDMGPGYVKALCAPLGHLKFLGVGGIDEKNCVDYLRAGVVGFGIGGNLVNREWIAAGEFDKITALAGMYVKAVKG